MIVLNIYCINMILIGVYRPQIISKFSHDHDSHNSQAQPLYYSMYSDQTTIFQTVSLFTLCFKKRYCDYIASSDKLFTVSPLCNSYLLMHLNVPKESFVSYILVDNCSIVWLCGQSKYESDLYESSTSGVNKWLKNYTF